MANQEACELWIEQRIEEEQAKGTSHPEIGRIIGAEIVKLFEAKIQARTIEQRSRRISATNVASPPTPESSKENQDNQVLEVCRKCGHEYRVTACNYGPDGCPRCYPPKRYGGQREGAGRKGKYERPPIKREQTLNENTFTPSFKRAFDYFFVEIKNAKRLGWKDVSREAALMHLAVLYDLLTI